MKQINLHNYEAFLLDYIEGNLTSEQQEQLQAFVLAHPELDIDLNDDDLVGLNKGDEIEFPDKDVLKVIGGLDVIDPANDEDHFIASSEGDLSEAQQAALNQYLKMNPDRQSDFLLYQQLKMKADLQLEYPLKQNLKKTRVIVVPMYAKIAAAAAVLAVVFFNIQTNEVPFEDNGIRITQSEESVNDGFRMGSTNMNLSHPLSKRVATERTQQPVVANNLRNNVKGQVEHMPKEAIDKVSLPSQPNSPTRKMEVIAESNESIKKSKDIYLPVVAKEDNSDMNTDSLVNSRFDVVTTSVTLNEKEDSVHNPETLNLAEYVSMSVSDFIGADLELKKNSTGKLSAYAIKIGRLSISRKKAL